MAVAKIYDSGSASWIPAIIGAQGPTGPSGEAGPAGPASLEISATPPEDTTVLWADTSDPGDNVIPPGGTAGQALLKVDGTNYNTTWGNIPSETPIVQALTPTTGFVNLDFSNVHNKYLTHDLTGDVTYTTSNVSAGKTVTIRVKANGAQRLLVFPSWVFVGNLEPASIASGKTAILTVTFFGGADHDAVAAWAVEP